MIYTQKHENPMRSGLMTPDLLLEVGILERHVLLVEHHGNNYLIWGVTVLEVRIQTRIQNYVGAIA